MSMERKWIIANVLDFSPESAVAKAYGIANRKNNRYVVSEIERAITSMYKVYKLSAIVSKKLDDIRYDYEPMDIYDALVKLPGWGKKRASIVIDILTKGV